MAALLDGTRSRLASIGVVLAIVWAGLHGLSGSVGFFPPCDVTAKLALLTAFGASATLVVDSFAMFVTTRKPGRGFPMYELLGVPPHKPVSKENGEPPIIKTILKSCAKIRSRLCSQLSAAEEMLCWRLRHNRYATAVTDLRV